MARLALLVPSALGLLLAVCATRASGQTAVAPPVLARIPSAVLSGAAPAQRVSVAALRDSVRTLDAFVRAQRLRTLARSGQRASVSAADPAQRQALRRLRERPAALGAARVVLRPGTLTPRQIAGRVLEPAAAGGGPASADAETARRLFRAERALLRLDDPDLELRAERAETDALGHRHLRFSQAFAGIPVWPSELIVHLDPAGDAYLLDGGSVPTPRGVPVAPRIAPRVAVARAIHALGTGADATAEMPELVIFAPGDRVARLAWRFAVDAGPRFRRRVAIDAQNGKLLFSVSEVMDVNVAGSGLDLFGVVRPLDVWNETGVHYLVDASKPMFDPTSDPPEPATTRGAISVLDAQNQPATSNPTSVPALFHITSANPNAWSVPAGVSAAFNLSRTYDYYLTRHARNSLDGAGGSILGVVRYGLGYYNAFWHSGLQAMFFGDAAPFAGAPDVVGHELTHGVTDATARLLYLDQSGAANEAFSDVFGEMVETSIDGAPDWLLGADLSEAIRNMANPDALEIGCGRQYPARMSQFLLASDPLCGVSVAFDNGGVHLNSGILNRAFYLLAAGLPGALGTTAAEQIFYRALTLHLTSTAQFVDVRLAAIASAAELFGAGSPQAQRTAQAFDEVEIFDGAGTGPPAPLPPLSGDDSTLFLRLEPAFPAWFLWRQEALLADPDEGSNLSYFDVSRRRASVTRDGSVAWFVDSVADLCAIATDADPLSDPLEQETCAGLAGLIDSVAVSGDGNFVALVLNDLFTGQPTNEIMVLDLQVIGGVTLYPLVAPTRDGSPSSTLLFADAMSFTASGGALVFDALNALPLPGGSVAYAWSIYLLDLTSGSVFDVVAPLPDANFGFPALSRTSDAFITFDALDAAISNSTVYAGNLLTGDLAAIDTVNGLAGIPSYTGDDSRIVYSEPAPTASGASLFFRALASDRITPTGPRTLWLADADFGVVYRRGAFIGPGPDADGDGILEPGDNCPNERNAGQEDDGALLTSTRNGVGNACECGDLGIDGRIDDPDITALRSWLARAPGPTPALQRCSVIGGIECDVADFAVLVRARNGFAPSLASVCAAASPL